MIVPQELLELVDRFERNKESYTSPSSTYNETQVRREFIDPLFRLLGWDVDNTQGYAEAYKDVIHEDAIKVGSMTKAPDYCFRIGPQRKFFLEAKRPSHNVGNDKEAAWQLRRYGWSAKLPLSILTDFQEFAVYDCRKKPSKYDAASVARILLVDYTQYHTRWEEIAAIFSRDAILKGSFDKYAASATDKRGTAEVDGEFLKEIESWRLELARSLAWRHPELTVPELNFAVQRTIDRIIFLRICEDRGIETYGQLLGLRNGEHVYERLLEIFHRADDRYNSGLFHFESAKGRHEQPDELTPRLTFGSQVFKKIIGGLYYPDCPYEFSVLPADILGQVYEQFLGKVIRLGPRRRAEVDDKPEVKKAGGVYYTPTYIVDYIVKHTVGELVDRAADPAKVAKLRILDPACGSGSFLIAAYQYLLDWHLAWYTEHEPETWAKKKNPPIYRATSGDGEPTWRLTTTERKRILLKNIYGVDIDSQAVEVTKLSLLLKVLEQQTKETVDQSLRLLHERALPDLGDNIKCGNSLIATDFYTDRADLSAEERARINPLDWDTEFPGIMKSGGFDAVIGNPPWGATFATREQAYLRGSYASVAAGGLDSYVVFAESALRRLRPHGLLSFITPDTFLRKDDHLPIRRLLLGDSTVVELVETGPVFARVRDTWCCVFCVRRATPSPQALVRHKKVSRFIVAAEARLAKFGKAEWDSESTVPQALWTDRPSMIVGYLASAQEQALIEKLERHPPLGQITERFLVSRGEEGSKFALVEQGSGDFHIVTPADVERYACRHGLRVESASLTKTKLSACYRHPKLWMIRIQKLRWPRRLVCTLDTRSHSAGMKTLQLAISATDSVSDLAFLQGILASQLVNFWCVNYLADDMNQSYLERIPIPNEPGKSHYDLLVDLVQRMLSLNTALAATGTEYEADTLQRQIDATDRQIDALVYELYGLTDEEIAVVEAETR
ncbi:MAG: N-6 DNA methylase [Armatimonadota bacterium]|nr:N-6 DNA methylase [Armatimonadota bacterium]